MPELISLPSVDTEYAALLVQLAALRHDMVRAAAQAMNRLEAVHPNFWLSAHNLVHYLALRQHDLRPLQQQLATVGLSSLGRAEGHALATVDAVLAALLELAPPTDPVGLLPPYPAPDFRSGPRLLAEHSDALLGPPRPARDVRIMVTMPSQAATDYPLVRELLRQGMDCMRINCAHDEPTAWRRMIQHLRRAEQELGLSCRVSMDLAGPKLRTTGLPPGPAVLQLQPERDAYGRVLAPARLWLTAREQPQDAPTAATATLEFPAAWLRKLHPGDVVSFVDARGARRVLLMQGASERGGWAYLFKTAYITPHTRFKGPTSTATVHQVPCPESYLLLRPGDALWLTTPPVPPASASGGTAGSTAPALIGCTLPEVFDHVKPGERIWFDDGKIGGIVERVEPGAVHVRITQARELGEKLRNDKGINLPDSQLPLGALTAEDREHLAFVVQHADMVALSFVSSPDDVSQLQDHMVQLGGRVLPILLKIETRRGFDQLPALLLRAMQASSCGVMIARGDLAVECGFERLAEVQEEILWLCEAAHVPVIWATQVLESLARGGMPSRAEITDAAMGDRAECVMLNKGPRVVEAVRILDDILQRMADHQHKKSALLRSLHVAHALPELNGEP
ncbi:pyruvate kinase [Hymenobacter sp. BT683]|uniref:pyruvate kinase n=1 Tax=Hymenobacter jeongseonensis TaxID=2791027 RepID=A0ABS0ILU1_9BACT|nr:pyruvate kinase [Hymenobacter jeongseonensis]MBF9239334.1 pyruvate kinase [Hymenobacter jeongseonensis]